MITVKAAKLNHATLFTIERRGPVGPEFYLIFKNGYRVFEFITPGEEMLFMTGDLDIVYDRVVRLELYRGLIRVFLVDDEQFTVTVE